MRVSTLTPGIERSAVTVRRRGADEQHRDGSDRGAGGVREVVEHEAVGGIELRAIDRGRRDIWKLDRADGTGIDAGLRGADRFTVAGDCHLERLCRRAEVRDRQARMQLGGAEGFAAQRE